MKFRKGKKANGSSLICKLQEWKTSINKFALSCDGGEPVQVLLYYNEGKEGIGLLSWDVGCCDLTEDIQISTVYLAIKNYSICGLQYDPCFTSYLLM